MADLGVSQDQVAERPLLKNVYVYYVDRSDAASGVQSVVTKWDCDSENSVVSGEYCYTHHFYVSKEDWKTDRDYLFIVDFDIEGINIRGNCYAVDCNGKIKST